MSVPSLLSSGSFGIAVGLISSDGIILTTIFVPPAFFGCNSMIRHESANIKDYKLEGSFYGRLSFNVLSFPNNLLLVCLSPGKEW